MKVLLDENFPLGLVRVLRDAGLEVDHIITLGWRGASDARIRQRLTDAETQQVVRRFELTDDGVLLPWSTFPLQR